MSGRTEVRPGQVLHAGYAIERRIRYDEVGASRDKGAPHKEAGFHEAAIGLVSSGDVDASAIDSQVLAVELRDHPRLLQRLRVIEAFGPSTIQPVVAAKRLPESLKVEVRHVLLEMEGDPVAREFLLRGFIERFVSISDSSYDDIRSMLEAAERSRFMVLG